MGDGEEKPTIKLEIISDVICPFCYVAKRQLYEGIEQMKDRANVDVTWLPYFLDPDLVKGREKPKKESYIQKYGADQAERMIEKLENSFAEVGIKYNHESLTANTLDAHRLIEWAQEKGTRKQRDALVENLFHFYFAEAKNVGDLSVLADAAEKSGLDRTEAEAVLKSDEYERNIDQKMWINQTKGIPGVPTFVFQGKFKFSGARSPEFFKGLLEQILEM